MSKSSGRPRGPGVVYAAIALAMMVIVGVIALSAAQPPPPTIAEFAPQAVENITDAPQEQTSKFGSAGNGAGGAEGEATPTPGPGAGNKAEVIDVPRVRHCIGDPPRQTEDPQSPPCVPYFAGDNGGATSKGVTANEVIISYPVSIEKIPDIQLLASFFNSRYEFYGRKIRLASYTPRGGAFGKADAAAMNADAQGVAEEQQAFGSITYPGRDGAEKIFYDELARRKVLSVDVKPSSRNGTHFASKAPYQWAVQADFGSMMRTYGKFLCSSLSGRSARYAGADLASTKRTFGLVIGSAADGSTADSSILKNELSRCGESFVAERTLNSDSSDLREGQSVMLDFKLEPVTSVVCLCSAGQLDQKLMRGATAQGYQPEWLVQAYQSQDFEAAGTTWPKDQSNHAFGLTFRNKLLPLEDMPWYSAVKSIDPTWQPDRQQGYNTAMVERYWELLVMAAGIQMAGPKLTPATFAAGLQKARFPNPAAGAAPLFQAGVSFSGSDFTFFDDAAMIWWSQSDRNYTANVSEGAYCYVDRGRRYQASNWPSGDPAFFSGPCR